MTLCVKLLHTHDPNTYLFVLDDLRAEGSLLVKLKPKKVDGELPAWLSKETANLALTIGEVDE